SARWSRARGSISVDCAGQCDSINASLEKTMDYEKLSILLPVDIVRSLREAVDGERYVVESDVVLEALQDWQVKQQCREAKLQRLRGLIEEGVASGSKPMAG